MRPPNPEREKELYELWLTEHTIDEATSITNVPRSTVGYYFKKFKKKNEKDGLSKILRLESDSIFNVKGSDGKSSPHKSDKRSNIEKMIRSERARNGKKRSQDELLTSSLEKFLTTKEIIDLMTKKDYTRLYYFLSCWKILNENIQRLKLDPEELESIMKAFQKNQQHKT